MKLKSTHRVLIPGIAALGALLLQLAAPAPAQTSSEPAFFFRDGDRVVVAGDSITVKGDYARIIETFIRTRFPRWGISVRNGGTNGQTSRGGLATIDTDVFAWQPTVVVLNWGMNDGRNAQGVANYQAGITSYIDRLQSGGIHRIVLCSNSPLDIGDPPGTYSDYNRNFDEMSAFAQRLAREKGLVFVDQFHFCHTLWGENRRREAPVPVTAQTLARHVSDSVHAQSPGQLTMAYIILKTLGAPPEVSFASIDAATGHAETRRCRVADFAHLESGAGIRFTRVDEASPCWIDDAQAPGLELVSFNEDLNRMPLRVTGLAAGTYELRVDEVIHGRFTAAELAVGINLSLNRASPLMEAGRAVAELVSRQQIATQEARAVMSFDPSRGPRPAAPWLTITDLDAQRRAEVAHRVPLIEAFDCEISAAAQPRPHRYEIRAVSEGAP